MSDEQLDVEALLHRLERNARVDPITRARSLERALAAFDEAMPGTPGPTELEVVPIRPNRPDEPGPRRPILLAAAAALVIAAFAGFLLTRDGGRLETEPAPPAGQLGPSIGPAPVAPTPESWDAWRAAQPPIEVAECLARATVRATDATDVPSPNAELLTADQWTMSRHLSLENLIGELAGLPGGRPLDPALQTAWDTANTAQYGDQGTPTADFGDRVAEYRDTLRTSTSTAADPDRCWLEAPDRPDVDVDGVDEERHLLRCLAAETLAIAVEWHIDDPDAPLQDTISDAHGVLVAYPDGDVDVLFELGRRVQDAGLVSDTAAREAAYLDVLTDLDDLRFASRTCPIDPTEGADSP